MGLDSFQISRCNLQQLGIIFETPKALITVIAQDSSDNTSTVVVVNMQAKRPSTS
jgi:hypothetical protein